MAAICQIRQTNSEGRAYFDRRVAEGKTKKEALRVLKRHVSNAVYRQLVADAQRSRSSRAREDKRERLCSQRDRLNIPRGRLFGEVTSRTRQHATTDNPNAPRGQPRAPKTPAAETA
jgi:hypothetical protein